MPYPDVEGGVKAWLRARPEVTSTAVGTRTFVNGVPRSPTYPLITVQRVGGGDDPSDAPVDLALVQIDVWGAFDDSGLPKLAEATAVVNGVRDALDVINTRTTLSSGVDCFGATVAGVVRMFDPADGRLRYSITAEVTAINS